MTPAAKHSRIIVMKPSSTLHHIPAGEDFAAALVRGSWRGSLQPKTWLTVSLLLPNRRLAKSVRLAFLRHSDGQALVLPRMLPIGDVEEDAIELAAAGWDSGDLPPVIGGLERQLHLARQLASSQIPWQIPWPLPGHWLIFLIPHRPINVTLASWLIWPMVITRCIGRKF